MLVRPGFELATPRSADQCSADWASRAKVSTTVEWRVCSTFCYMYSMSCTVWTILEHITHKIHLAGRVRASEPVLKIPGVSLYTPPPPPHPKKNHVEAIMRQLGVMAADYTCEQAFHLKAGVIKPQVTLDKLIDSHYSLKLRVLVNQKREFHTRSGVTYM